MNDIASDRKPLSGRTVLVWLLAFFGVVMVMNAVMITLAIRTLPGTEVDNAYQAGLKYNSEISAAQAQNARGWKVGAELVRDADAHAAIRIEARDKTGAPLTGLAMSARLMRPIDSRADRVFAITEREAGIYRGGAADVPPGQWDLVIEAGRGGPHLFLSRNRVVLK